MRTGVLTSILILFTMSSAASFVKQGDAGVQLPMNPGIVHPPEKPENTNAGGSSGDLTIADVLPRTRSINIFASLTRDIASISGRLDSMGDNTTLLAPLNSAMQHLPRKPWEDPPEDTSGVRAASNEEKAAKNIQRFVEEHIIPVSPWKGGKEHKVKSLGGKDLWWEEKDGKRVVMPDEIIVDGIVGKVGNGQVWAVKGVVNYVQ